MERIGTAVEIIYLAFTQKRATQLDTVGLINAEILSEN